MKEYIMCAATWYKDYPVAAHGPGNITKGIVLCGRNHASIIQQHVILSGKSAFEMGDYEQGFLTSYNRFVDREEGMLIAKAIGQTDSKSKRLFSEDLYMHDIKIIEDGSRTSSITTN